MLNTKIVLLEFNELCPQLIEKFISEGQLPNFQKFRGESQVCTTTTHATSELLNPWVQWVTVHTGLTAEEHQVKTLSDGHNLKLEFIWDKLSSSGRKVWVCGSMNAGYRKPLNGFLLPDPWSTGIQPSPDGEFTAFYNFVRNSVQEHTNESNKPPNKKQFLSYLLKRRVSPSTILMMFLQILGEKFKETKWKRAMVLDQIQYDIFQYYFKRYLPDFSTFFINSTAHYQHCYWREMDPQAFSLPPSIKNAVTYRNAILEGYKNMDKLLGKFMRLSRSDTILVLCTALSQQPYLESDEKGGRHYFRIKDPNFLSSKFLLEGKFNYEPVMAEQFSLKFPNVSKAQKAKEHLSQFKIDDHRVFPDGSKSVLHSWVNDSSLMVQCQCTSEVPEDVTITNYNGSRLGFYDVFYKVDTVKSGKHHPDGILWTRNLNRKHEVVEEKIMLNQVHDRLLSHFN